MPNRFHLVLWPRVDGELRRWMHWVLATQGPPVPAALKKVLGHDRLATTEIYSKLGGMPGRC
jgi:hypothetical protein